MIMCSEGRTQLAKSVAVHWRDLNNKQRPEPYVVEPRMWFADATGMSFAVYELMTEGDLDDEWKDNLRGYQKDTSLVEGHTIAQWQYFQAMTGLAAVHATGWAHGDLALYQWLVVKEANSAFPIVKLGDLDEAENVGVNDLMDSDTRSSWLSPGECSE